jgi:hypothetical protein
MLLGKNILLENKRIVNKVENEDRDSIDEVVYLGSSRRSFIII